jgi:uncharacterized phiE125 gp8 family phage protein
MLTLMTAPTLVPVTLAEAKANSRVTTSAEDALITDMIDTAVQEAEAQMKRAICPQQWKLTMDNFNAETRESAIVYLSAQQWRPAMDSVKNTIYIRRPIVRSIDSVKYIDLNGTQQLLDPSQYLVDIGGHLQSRITPGYNLAWPAARQQINAVEILFTCGWADVASVPAVIKRWIKQRVSAYFENREDYVAGKTITNNPQADRMLDRWTVQSF